MNGPRMLRVYVAGPISANTAQKVLTNLGQGIREGARIFNLGASPFVPHLNYHFSLEFEHENDTYYEADNVWLDVSDVVVMLPRWKTSKGAKAEKRRAEGLGIPVYLTVAGFVNALRAGRIRARNLVEQKEGK